MTRKDEGYVNGGLLLPPAAPTRPDDPDPADLMRDDDDGRASHPLAEE